jgi:hypothetical protein
MRTTGMVIAPDHDRPTRSKNPFVLVHITYLVIHNKTGAANFFYTHTYLGTI